MEKQTIKLEADTRPLMFFIQLVRNLPQSSLIFSKLSSEFIRVETDDTATGASKLAVVLYPSDSFLRYAATVCAGDFDSGVIKETSHRAPPSRRQQSNTKGGKKTT